MGRFSDWDEGTLQLTQQRARAISRQRPWVWTWKEGQQDVIGYLVEENWVLKEQMKGRSHVFSKLLKTGRAGDLSEEDR